MGINVRFAEHRTELAERITREREARELALRVKVLRKELSLEEYLVRYKGYRREDLAEVLPRFREEFFGAKVQSA